MGIDTHKYEHTAVVINRFEEQLTSFNFVNTPSALHNFLNQLSHWHSQYRQDSYQDLNSSQMLVGIEGSHHHGFELAKALIQQDYLVYEVNSIYTKSRRGYGTSWDKSDEIDARLIASVLTRHLDQLPQLNLNPAFVSADFQSLVEAVAYLEDLIQTQTRIKNKLHHLFHLLDSKYRSKFKAVFGYQALKYWQRRAYRHHHQLQYQHLLSLLRQYNSLQKQLSNLDQWLKFWLINHRFDFLLTLPGVGVRNGAKLMAYIQDINRFSNQDKFCRYVGCVPEQHSSGTRTSFHKAKMSHKQLYRTFYSIALTQLKLVPSAKEYYDKKLDQHKTKKQARRSLIKNLAVIVYQMLKHYQSYQPTNN